MKVLLPILYVVAIIGLSRSKTATELKEEKELDIQFESEQDFSNEDDQQEFFDNEMFQENENKDDQYNDDIEESEQDLLDNELEDEDDDEIDEYPFDNINQDLITVQEDTQDTSAKRTPRKVGALARLLQLPRRLRGRGRRIRRCPTIRFPCRFMPNVCANIRNAFRRGKPRTLFRTRSRSQIRRNRRLSGCRRLGRRRGYNCDEYPFASSFQDGRGAVVRLVPIRENSIQ